MIRKIKSIWHFIKCVLILRTELPVWKKRKFGFFGKDSTIYMPSKLISSEQNIIIGNNTTILKYARMQCYDYNHTGNSKIQIGDNCYIGFNFTVLSGPEGKIIIGNNVLIASDVLISNENHGINPEIDTPYMDQELSVSSVIIEDECWIGEKVCILPGVKIGKKSIIGAASVVTHDIPAYSIAVGSPAKIIKYYDFNVHNWVSKER